ncbi:MAG: ferrous iron transport protein A [candidate division KSB1 bacterium]|nr:ferrous iron transport protein A [candidate division KSB1 bacterium]MDZ7367759.1 ferrous iron transport protein A [candidate division KSB1 bacterium]MDZ7406276.1 ferrous iron transport protein A [candidate division KSB1 bacterium]
MKIEAKLNPLTDLKKSVIAEIKQIVEGHDLWPLLREIGLHPGDHVELVRQAPFGGPLHVRCNGQNIALSRNLAGKILVETINKRG